MGPASPCRACGGLRGDHLPLAPTVLHLGRCGHHGGRGYAVGGDRDRLVCPRGSPRPHQPHPSLAYQYLSRGWGRPSGHAGPRARWCRRAAPLDHGAHHMNIPAELRRAVDFFYKHAGFSYPVGATKAQAERSRRAGALRLAQAEAFAEDAGMFVDWVHDDDDTADGDDGPPNERFAAVLKSETGKVLASLGSIGDPDSNYMRVIEAELALEVYIQDVEVRSKDRPFTNPGLYYEHPSEFRVGDRVQLSPATDSWMRGDKFGEVVKIGTKVVHVHMDRSGKTLKVHPTKITEIVSQGPRRTITFPD